MTIRVFTGLPATGKTSTIINTMKDRQTAGGNVVLFLSSEHEELTRRPNVKPGGFMGCRTPGLSFRIDHVCSTEEAVTRLEAIVTGAMVVFDEAQFFQPEIVAAWTAASARGIDVLVGTPSRSQLQALEDVEHQREHMDVDCSCGEHPATHVFYEPGAINERSTIPIHLCHSCYRKAMESSITDLLSDVREADPFPGELHTYQPFYQIDMEDWKLIREDSPARLQIILDSSARSNALCKLLDDPVAQPAFLDLGCCSGFFTDGMASHGYRATGVDVSANFIDWGNRLSQIKGQSIRYLQSDAHQYLSETTDEFDVTSTFATLQWVMMQKDYTTGVDCFRTLFQRTRHVAVVEMGYTTEDIYRDRISDAPVIDKDWVLKMMQESGVFAEIEVHPVGENGIWRDIFVGFKQTQTSALCHGMGFDNAVVKQVSNASAHWEDGWLGTSFEVWLTPMHDLSQLTFEGWRPDEKADVWIQINGQPLIELEQKSGVFSKNVPVSIPGGITFRLSIETSPPVVAPDDDRSLALVLRRLEFN